MSTNGAASFTILPAKQLPKFTQCAGNQLYERASDPWVSFPRTGNAHQISLSFNNTANLNNAVLVKSSAPNAGTQWSAPTTLKRDTDPAVFNDKESITAIRTTRTMLASGIGWVPRRADKRQVLLAHGSL